ncbi:MAG: putative ribosome biogenesis GTPase RsgA [Gammaproteobacteria bacterium]|nr:MAG: putative ribosome biogenesis GTPase RsgA [Gammaproteobacteria bacterium]
MHTSLLGLAYTITMTKRRLTEQQARRIKAQRSHSDGEAVNGSEHGLVIARYGKQALIESRTGERLLCHLRPHLESPVAGDEVLWEPTENKGVVTALITRRNVLERPDLQGRLRPVAANIDLMLIVFAPEPAPQPALLDRYLVAAEHIDVEPVVILNKADLLMDSSQRDQLQHYAALGYRTLETHRNLADASDLHSLINGQTLVWSANPASANPLLSSDSYPTPLSGSAHFRRSLTKAATRPQRGAFSFAGGGRLIDSPGVRDFGLSHVTAGAVAQGFREFWPYLGQCRFRDCQHGNEPDCALQNAVTEGVISGERFQSYQQIVASLSQDD